MKRTLVKSRDKTFDNLPSVKLKTPKRRNVVFIQHLDNQMVLVVNFEGLQLSKKGDQPKNGD